MEVMSLDVRLYKHRINGKRRGSGLTFMEEFIPHKKMWVTGEEYRLTIRIMS